MKRINIIIVSVVSMLSAVMLFTACFAKTTDESGDKETIVTEVSETTVPEQTETTEETAQPVQQTDINVLTGEPLANADAWGKRPVAVMVNNKHESLPQYGTGVADLIYELPVEGGITRLMAVYPDYANMPNVCSIRSCRYTYPIIANGIDAFYLHWGSDKSIAKDTLSRLNIDNIDGEYISSPVFGRDKNRKNYATEHTGYLSGSGLKKYLEENNYRLDRKNNNTVFQFAKTDEAIIPDGGMTANTVTFNFSKSYYSTFSYNTETGKYTKQHSGKAHIDSSTGNQLEFKNVIALKTKIENMSPESPLMNIELTSGEGYYISNGAAELIKWNRKDDESPIELFKADGTSLKINAGKSYVGVIGTEKTININ